jgi:hypothetical protein
METYLRTDSADGVKWVLGFIFIVLLVIGAYAVGVLFGNSYWGNPPLQEALAEEQLAKNEALRDELGAEAEKQRLENKIAKETWEIEAAARRKKIEDDSWARREKAAQGMRRADRWNELLITLAPILLAILTLGVLVIAAARILWPRLQEKAIELEKVRLRRAQQEFRLKQLDMQHARTLEKARGNGGGYRSPVEQSIIPTHIAA